MKRRDFLRASGLSATGLTIGVTGATDGDCPLWASLLPRPAERWFCGDGPWGLRNQEPLNGTETPTETPTATETPTPDPRDPLEVAVYYYKERKAASVLRDYVEFALADVWPVDVWVVDDPVPRDVARVDDDENDYAVDPEYEFIDYIHGGDNRSGEHYESHQEARDCNILVSHTTDSWAIQGGDVARVGGVSNMADLHGDEPVQKGYGFGHAKVNTGLHEVGHCFGLSHGASKPDGCEPPMLHRASDCKYHGYAPESITQIRDYADDS